jgi:hypothetical protein
LVAAACYWALTAIFTYFQQRLERRMSRGYVRTVAAGSGHGGVRFVPGAGGGPGGGGMMLEIPESADPHPDDREGTS